MKKELPIYKMVINDDDQTGVNYIALVDRPAIEVNWQKFNNHQRFKVQDAERRIISGALMVADMPIYRYTPQRGEFYVVFDKETIYKIVQKYMKQGFTSNVNEMHDMNKTVKDVYLFESFIIDESRGIRTPIGYDELPEGSWFGSMKVDNEQVWQEFISTNVFKGFSVEGDFGLELDQTPIDAELIAQIDELIAKLHTIK
jgi:hypothetical protein